MCRLVFKKGESKVLKDTCSAEMCLTNNTFVRISTKDDALGLGKNIGT